jgi:hypothetical protein
MPRRSVVALTLLAAVAATLAATSPAGAAPAAVGAPAAAAAVPNAGCAVEGAVELDTEGDYYRCQIVGQVLRWVLVSTCPTPGSNPGTPVGTGKTGYWMLGRGGEVYRFGDAVDHGDIVDDLASRAAAGIVAVDIEPTADANGYWILDSQGCIHDFGNAGHFGEVNIADLSPGERVTSISAPPVGVGYWVFTNRGRAIEFSPAVDYGDVSALTLNGPVIDSSVTPNAMGYYMVASDGGVFAFGNAVFKGSTGNLQLNSPAVGLVPDPDGVGYWFVAADGGVFAFDAPFRSSIPAVLPAGQSLNQPIIGMVAYGNAYLMVASDGGIFNFATDKEFRGSLGANPPALPIVSVAVLET